MRVLVTGSSTFFGARLLQELGREGNRVTAADSLYLSSGKASRFAERRLLVPRLGSDPEGYFRSVKDSSGKIYSQYRTATTYLDPFGKQVLDAFWDTSKVLAGTYTLEIDLAYLQKTSKQVFSIFVDNDRISTSPTGQVTGKAENETSAIMRAIYILMFLVIGLIIFNVVMFMRRKRRL